jgi:nucleoside-diphosphate-sugar epimerase
MLLLTGAAGVIGRQVLPRLNGEVVALRHRDPIPAPSVAGDIELPDFGLPRDFLERITGILHCAALTRFSADPADLQRVNVVGTRNLLALARKCPRLEKIGVLSTTYVAGRRTGAIFESELLHRAGFVNPYERSKYQMERMLRENMGRLPIVVYRMSTVVGDVSGKIVKVHALHQALRLYYHALVPMVPGTAASPIDLISSDYAAACLAHLFTKRFQAGRTYHIAAPESDRLPLERFLASTAVIFSKWNSRWRSGALSPPPIVPLQTFRLLEKSAHVAGNALLRQALAATGLFLPQLSFPKTFDRSQLDADLQSSGIHPVPLATYYPSIVRECVALKEVRRAHAGSV